MSIFPVRRVLDSLLRPRRCHARLLCLVFEILGFQTLASSLFGLYIFNNTIESGVLTSKIKNCMLRLQNALFKLKTRIQLFNTALDCRSRQRLSNEPFIAKNRRRDCRKRAAYNLDVDDPELTRLLFFESRKRGVLGPQQYNLLLKLCSVQHV